jgi:hypothetical protein
MALGSQSRDEIDIRIRIKIRMGLVYTSVRMLENARNPATFRHDFEG